MGGIPQAPGPDPIYLTLLSSMFMHGGWMHLGGNMLYLWIFGDNVEDAMGHFKFLMFYLVCGLGAGVAQIMSSPNSMVPSLGASGAIAGVLGAYLVMYPTRSVRVLIWWLGIVSMPAVIVIGLWLVLQVTDGIGSVAVTSQTGGGVAYFAHIGGALTGILLCGLFRNPEVRQRAQRRMSRPPGGRYGGGPYFGDGF
jgi:membrane associated rhomboid family serine protease